MLLMDLEQFWIIPRNLEKTLKSVMVPLVLFWEKKFYCDKYILNTGETFINPVSFSYLRVVILYNPEDNCKESQ